MSLGSCGKDFVLSTVGSHGSLLNGRGRVIFRWSMEVEIPGRGEEVGATGKYVE